MRGVRFTRTQEFAGSGRRRAAQTGDARTVHRPSKRPYWTTEVTRGGAAYVAAPTGWLFEGQSNCVNLAVRSP
jgi:hypothetical protein